MRRDASPFRRHAAWAVVVAFCAALVPAGANAAPDSRSTGGAALSMRSATAETSARSRTRIQGFQDETATVVLGRTLRDSVVVLPRSRRVVLVQARRPGSAHFQTQSTGHSTAGGRFTAAYVPTSPGTWRFRLVVKATATRAAAVSDVRVVRAIDRMAPGAVSGLTTSTTIDSATLTWVNPVDPDFTGVTIRREDGPVAPSSPVEGTAVTTTGRNATTFTDTGLTDNSEYSYALFVRDGSGNVGHAATATLRTQRLAVTDVGTTSVTRTTVALAWTNPMDDAFTGVVIRRADGPTPPASVSDGTAVTDLSSPESTFTDDNGGNGLAPGTQYSYALFAHDADHVAPAATITVTTRAPGTDAVLKVNPLLSNGARVTVGTVVAFDASDSLAAAGADVTSWSIDYGDGTGDTFTAPFVPLDGFNATHTYTSAGDLPVSLTVHDSSGGSATDTVIVHVFDAPTVTVSASGTTFPAGDVPLTVAVDTPLDTTITSYQIVVSGDDTFFIDGDSDPSGTVPLSFLPGTYTVVVTVANDAGGIGVSDPLVIEVQ